MAYFLLFGALVMQGAAAIVLPTRTLANGGSAAYDLPLTWNPAGFLSTALVGTPPQKLPVFVDWTWINFYVLTTTCYGRPNTKASCISPTQQFFNETASSTFRYRKDLYPSRTWNPNHFFFDNNLSVDHATDIVTIGPSSAEVLLQASDTTFNMSSLTFPFAGVYGLSPVFPSDNASTSSAFRQAWRNGAWPSPITGFHYCYKGSPDKAKASCGGHDGVQTLGGVKSSVIQAGRVYWYRNRVFPDVNRLDFIYKPGLYNYWGIELESLWIGGEHQDITKTANNPGPAAIFDHASYGRGMPLSSEAYERLVQIAGAVPAGPLASAPNNGEQPFYKVECSRVPRLPPVKYRLVGHTKVWSIEARNYVERMQGGVCLLNVRTLAAGSEFLGNFGETFAKDKYVVFDFEKLAVGIADVQW